MLYSVTFKKCSVPYIGIILVGYILIQYLFLNSSYFVHFYGDVHCSVPGDDYSISHISIDWETVTRLSPIPSIPNSDKWVVITSINYPSNAVIKLSKQNNWTVVVVGDKKTPKDWKLENAIFLDIETQNSLNFRINKLIPFNHYSRKNIGYLFAILHGAQIIYETDDDNILREGNSLSTSFSLNEHVKDFLVFDTKAQTVNPYAHFGQASIWPRGYPLELIGAKEEYTFVNLSEINIPVQQGLANGDPDVDAIFRLTRKNHQQKMNITFNDYAPPVAIPHGTLVPWNTQNTLFHYNAFWGLLVPVTTTFRVCDIWRSYWVQRILWYIGAHLSFWRTNIDLLFKLIIC